MRGTITGVKKYASPIFFIMGDDGVEYFCGPKHLVNKHWYEKFVWNGNTAEFDIEPPAEGYTRPEAVNVVPEFQTEPGREERRAKFLEQKRISEEKAKLRAEQKKRNIEEQARLRREAQERRALRDLNTVYVMQIWKDGKWQDFEYNGDRFIYKTVREANMFMFGIKDECPNDRFRYVKREWDNHGVRLSDQGGIDHEG